MKRQPMEIEKATYEMKENTDKPISNKGLTSKR